MGSDIVAAEHSTDTGAASLAIHCLGVQKSYTSGSGPQRTVTHALRGVNLDVRRGELMMLVGPSGCGKTTLLSVLAGILNQDSGTVLVEGEDINHLPERQRSAFRGHALGFVFQSYNLIPSLSISENVSVPLIIRGCGWDEASVRAEAMLAKVGLGDRAQALPRHLSGGQQQRVAIARAMVHDPKIIVCDEPTSALDQDTGHLMMELFREVVLTEGRTLVIVTHDSRIFSFADRIARMNDGEVLEVVEAASLSEETHSH